MYLRSKLTLALLLTSFAAIVAVGLISRSIMLARFDDLVAERAVDGFVQEILDYHRTHGSWEAARAAESFPDFARRTGLGSRDGRRPPGPRPGAPLDRTAGPRRRPGPAGAPPPFAVTDRDGVALIPLAGVEVGGRVPSEKLDDAIPILDGSTEIGLAVLLDRPALTDLEERYLSAMRDSWLWALVLASGVAVLLGLVFAARLARPIRDMTVAMGEMQDGRLRQKVAVRSRDELGRLARRFNQMSSRLADAYEELEASRSQLDVHAREMAELSRRDALTGLFNRRAFDERVDQLMAQGRRYDHPLSIAMIDLDHFKRINDEHSHAVGDQVLERAARLLANGLREADVAARYGGEEFVVAFPETPIAAAVRLAERMRGRFESTDWSDLAPDLSVTISVGLEGASRTDDLRTVLARADAKLYRAKRSGRNRVVA